MRSSTFQTDARLAATRLWDVAVIGGGPAGAIAALHLARDKRSVVVIERDRYPRDKACGDALIADSIRVLERAGMLAEVERRALEARAFRVYSPSRLDVVIPIRTLLIKRIEFDALLARTAAEAGAVVVQGDVHRVDAGALAQVVVRDLAAPVRAKVAVIATGANTRLLRAHGMVERSQPSVVAVSRYVHSPVAIDHLILSFDRTIAPGYAWLFPLPGGVYNVGCGMAYGTKHARNLAATLDRFIRDFQPLREFSNAITHAEPLRGALLRCGLGGTSFRGSPNILAIGESIGTTFPFTGEGIGKAMESGERAAAVVSRALEANDLSLLDTFAAEMNELEPRYRGYEVAEKWFSRPWLADLVTYLLRRNRRAVQSAEAVLNDTADPRDLFSMRGLWRMMRS